jgi:hypothetical protein
LVVELIGKVHKRVLRFLLREAKKAWLNLSHKVIATVTKALKLMLLQGTFNHAQLVAPVPIYPCRPDEVKPSVSKIFPGE